MRISATIQDSIVDGPGLRFTVFTQGCPHHCEGCHNPQTHDYDGGTETTVAELAKKLLGNPLTDGLTLSGGEPFVQAAECAELAAVAREAKMNVWTYSGYTFDELLKLSETQPEIGRLLELTDVLVDGRFEMDGRSLELKWRGSRNQRIVDVARSLSSGEVVTLE